MRRNLIKFVLMKNFIVAKRIKKKAYFSIRKIGTYSYRKMNYSYDLMVTGCPVTVMAEGPVALCPILSNGLPFSSHILTRLKYKTRLSSCQDHQNQQFFKLSQFNMF